MKKIAWVKGSLCSFETCRQRERVCYADGVCNLCLTIASLFIFIASEYCIFLLRLQREEVMVQLVFVSKIEANNTTHHSVYE